MSGGSVKDQARGDGKTDFRRTSLPCTPIKISKQILPNGTKVVIIISVVRLAVVTYVHSVMHTTYGVSTIESSPENEVVTRIVGRILAS